MLQRRVLRNGASERKGSRGWTTGGTSVQKDSGSARQGETTNTKLRAAARIALTC